MNSTTIFNSWSVSWLHVAIFLFIAYSFFHAGQEILLVLWLLFVFVSTARQPKWSTIKVMSDGRVQIMFVYLFWTRRWTGSPVEIDSTIVTQHESGMGDLHELRLRFKDGKILDLVQTQTAEGGLQVGRRINAGLGINCEPLLEVGKWTRASYADVCKVLTV